MRAPCAHLVGCGLDRKGMSPIMAGKRYENATPNGHNWTYPLDSPCHWIAYLWPRPRRVGIDEPDEMASPGLADFLRQCGDTVPSAWHRDPKRERGMRRSGGLALADASGYDGPVLPEGFV